MISHKDVFVILDESEIQTLANFFSFFMINAGLENLRKMVKKEPALQNAFGVFEKLQSAIKPDEDDEDA
jgi:hypothetical protein